MTRKDYRAIAEAINFYRASLNPNVGFDRDRYVALRELTSIFIEVFELDNRRFSRGLFLDACGFKEGGE